jgi:hypothetical protein
MWSHDWTCMQHGGRTTFLGQGCCFPPYCTCRYDTSPSLYHQAVLKSLCTVKSILLRVWPAQSHLVIWSFQGAQRATCLCVCISTVRCQTLEAEQLQAPALQGVHICIVGESRGWSCASVYCCSAKCLGIRSADSSQTQAHCN